MRRSSQAKSPGAVAGAGGVRKHDAYVARSTSGGNLLACYARTKPRPSKWDDAPKWLPRRAGDDDDARRRSSSADDGLLMPPPPQPVAPRKGAGGWRSWSNADGEEGETKTVDAVQAYVPLPLRCGVVSLRDVGTEMTPGGSKEPSRANTPRVVAVAAPAAAAHSVARGTSSPPRQCGGGVAVADHGAACESDEAAGTRTAVSPATAWGDAERAKYIARYRREEMKIQAWENRERRKAEPGRQELSPSDTSPKSTLCITAPHVSPNAAYAKDVSVRGSIIALAEKFFWNFADSRRLLGFGGESLMAAGSHGGYRCYEVAREREHDLGGSRRSKEYYHHRHPRGHRDSEPRRDGGRSGGRELSNGYGHRRSPHPPSRRRSSRRAEEREPGEVSSGSGAEKSGETPLKAREVRENGVTRVSKEVATISPSKKRKHSPVIWHRNGSKMQARDPVRGIREKKKSVSPVDSIERGSSKKVTSPEPGEVLAYNSGSSSRSSDSGVVQGSADRDLEVEKGDDMNVEVEAGDDYPADHLLDSDSEGNGCRSGTPECTQSPCRCINMLQGCRSVDEFERLNTINEGTYGVVFRVRDKRTGEIVALKKVKMEKEREGFPLTSLREINILLSSHHPSIVDVKEVVVGGSDKDIFMVMEYMEHDLKGVMETMKQPYSQSEVKCLMLQLLEGVKYLHDNWILHRDLKTSNLLLNNRGELKICDFGLSRQYGSPLKPYTQLVVTLWYRAPELLLGAKEYSTAIDMWSLGCIMAELLSKGPLFNGKSEIDQLDKIFKTLGTPDENIWPGYSKLPGASVKFRKQTHNRLRDKFRAVSFTGGPTLSEAGFDLLNRLLMYDPEKRISADDALNHEWFRELPLPRSKDFMPTFPALNEQDRRFKKYIKSPDPLEEQRIKEQGNNGDRGLFG
uniref:Protein kinase domain-containing protein n=1 Tax=Leersia perrieri TaxID=77586 RepID=A0A0D9VHX9_9ORYZ